MDTRTSSHSGTSVYHFRRALDYLRSASKCLRTAQASLGSKSIRMCAALYADTIDADLRLVAPDMDIEDARLQAAAAKQKRGVA